MRTEIFRSCLVDIAGRLPDEATLEQVYAQLALLNDIDMAEEEVRRGETYTHQEVKPMAS
jgi:hypothetical protein